MCIRDSTQSLAEILLQDVTRESLVTICYDECLADDIVVMVYKWYCGKDVNASALSCCFFDCAMFLAKEKCFVLSKIKTKQVKKT